MTDIPTSVDELVRDTRARIARMRRQLGDPQDFDQMIRRQLVGFLDGYDRKTVALTLRAVFGDD